MTFLAPAQTIPPHLACSKAALEKTRDNFPAGKWPPVRSQGTTKDYPCWRTGLLPTAREGAQPQGSDPHRVELCPDWPWRQDQGTPAAPAVGGGSDQLLSSTPKPGSGTLWPHIPLPARAAPGSKCGDGFPSRLPPLHGI